MITTIRRPVIKRCPFKDETDAGELVIAFLGEAPELHRLAAEIDALGEKPITHENFTAAIAAQFPEATVTTTWHTGPWKVEVVDGAGVRNVAAVLRHAEHAESAAGDA